MLKVFCLFLIAIFPVFAKSTTWKATTNDNLNNASNWTNGVPGAGDDALFDSERKNIETHPKATADFSPSTIQFLESARLFKFTFKNCILTFSNNASGNVGIFGQNTDTKITITNKNNNLANQLLLQGTTSNTTGSAAIYITNKATKPNSGVIGGSQLESDNPFFLGQGGILSAVNEGNLNAPGTGNVGYITKAQMLFDSTFTADDDAAILISNHGNFKGTGVGSNLIGYLGGSQFSTSGSASFGEHAAITLANSGRFNGNGSQVSAGFAAGQINTNGSFSVGDNSIISLSNKGKFNGTGSTNDIGYVNNSQMLVSNIFSAGCNAALNLSNEGRLNVTDTMSAMNDVGYVNGPQFQSGAFSVCDNAAITVANSGRYDGDGNNNNVGFIHGKGVSSQFLIGSGSFSAHDNLAINLSNFGKYNGLGSNNYVGRVDNDQLTCNAFSVGDNALINISNRGENSGNSMSSNNLVGDIHGSQFNSGAFCAGDNTTINISNSGRNFGDNGISVPNSVGSLGYSQFNASSFSACDFTTINLSNRGHYKGNGQNGVGFIGSANQLIVNQSFNIGDNALIHISNRGNYAGDGSMNNVGSLFAGSLYSGQLSIGTFFNAQDNLTIHISNFGKYNGSGVSNTVGYATNAQLLSLGDFNVEENASIRLSNRGNYAGDGSMNKIGYVDQVNGVSNTGSQFLTSGIINAQDNFFLKIDNFGKYNGSNDSNGVGYVFNDQLTSGSLCSGDISIFTLANRGSAKGNGSSNNVGSVSNQMNIAVMLSVGENSAISISNQGKYEGDGSDNSIGFAQGNQLNTSDVISLCAKGSIILSNEGKFAGNGSDNSVGFLSANQLNTSSFLIGDHASIKIANSGEYSGSGLGNGIGFVNSNQLSTTTLRGGDNLKFHISNRGKFTGTSHNFIGYISSAQVNLLEFCVGDNSTLKVSNYGKYSGDNLSDNSHPNKVGFTGDAQLIMTKCSTGSNAAIKLSNRGIYQGNGTYNFVSYDGGSQFLCGSFSTEDNTLITCINNGKYQGNGANNNIGFVGNSFKADSFNARDKLSVNLFQKGSYKGDGTSNDVGYIGSNQMEIDDMFNVGDKASITLSNKGKYKGDGTNQVGFVGVSQFATNGFCSCDKAKIDIANNGKYNGNGTGNLIGYIKDNQFEIDGACNSGDNTKIAITNQGNYTGSGTGNSVGYVGDEQLFVCNSFTAGKNLNLSVKNLSNGSSQAGIVKNSQIEFAGVCSLDKGFRISAFNSGTVSGNQIVFDSGLEICGKGTIKAVNSSNAILTGNGIVIGDGTGGDVNIVLKNSSLVVNSSFAQFTIGELNGNSNSFVNCNPTLNIDTDPLVFADFEGDIQNANGLIKSGLGTQKLSGANTFIGTTTIKEGNLNITGSLVGPVDILAAGTLSGTGTIGDTVTNRGTISPGESIGTLTMAGFLNQQGTYVAEVNGKGKSDLIKVTGSSTLNGGTVVVSSVDGTYRFHSPYTILTAGTLQGKFSDVLSVSPLIVPELSYDKHNVFLELATAICRAATTSNECKVAFQLDNTLDPNDRQNELLSEIVNLSLPEAQAALNSLTGQQHTHSAFFAEGVNRQFIRRLYDPLRFIVAKCSNPCGTLLAWVEGGGQYYSLKGNHSKGYEVTGGVQTTRNCFTLGVAGSYENDSLHYKRHGGAGKSRTWLVGLYGLYRPERFYGLADFAYGRSNNTLDRKVFTGAPIHSKPKFSTFTFYGEVGVDCQLRRFMVQPFVAVEAGTYRQDHIKEHGTSGWELILKEKERSFAASRLGLHLTACGLPTGWAASVDGAWNYRTYHTNVRERLVEFGSDFTIEGVKLNSNSVDYALTIAKNVAGWRFYVEGTGQNWNRASNYSVLGGCQFQW